MDYFRNFPVIEYNNFLAKNIMANVRLDPKTKQQAALYHQYAMSDGNKASTVAGKYYNDESLQWLIFFANDVIDPYYDVHLDIGPFANYITQKYGSVERAQLLTAGWVNDWTVDLGTLPVAVYDALLPAIKKYYDPIINDDRIVIGYTRAQSNMFTNTNKITKWTLASVIDAPIGTLLDVMVSSSKIGTCESVLVDSTTLTVQNVIVTSNTSPTHIRVYNSNTSISIANTVQEYDSIPLIEVPFWRNVSNYEVEYEINESKKNIKLISSQFAGELKRQFRGKIS